MLGAKAEAGGHRLLLSQGVPTANLVMRQKRARGNLDREEGTLLRTRRLRSLEPLTWARW